MMKTSCTDHPFYISMSYTIEEFLHPFFTLLIPEQDLLLDKAK